VVVPIIQSVFLALWSVLERVGRAIGTFARAMADGAEALWNNIIKPAFDAVRTFFGRVKQFLDRVAEPIRRVLDRINRALDWVWTRVIAPIIDVIDKVRLVLRLLAELGVEWAAKLDAFLLALETRIYESFRVVREWVNTFSSWIDVLFDPRGWIRATPWLYTLYRWGGNVVGILNALGLDVTTTARNELVHSNNPRRPISATVERFKDGTIHNSPGVQNAAARFRSGGTGRF
jgi:hypothetical protein